MKTTNELSEDIKLIDEYLTRLNALEKSFNNLNEVFSCFALEPNEFICEKYPFSGSFDEFGYEVSNWVQLSKMKLNFRKFITYAISLQSDIRGDYSSSNIENNRLNDFLVGLIFAYRQLKEEFLNENIEISNEPLNSKNFDFGFLFGISLIKNLLDFDNDDDLLSKNQKEMMVKFLNKEKQDCEDYEYEKYQNQTPYDFDNEEDLIDFFTGFNSITLNISSNFKE